MTDEYLDQMVQQQLGGPVQAAQPQLQQPAPAATATATPPTPKQDPNADKDTAMDQAITSQSPNTEANKSKAQPFEFMKINVNGKDEVYSPSQIEGIVPRYKDMNYKYQTEIAPVKGTLDYINSLRSDLKANGIEVSDEQLSQLLRDSLNEYSNKEMQFGANTTQLNTTNNTQRQSIPIDNDVGSTSNMDWDSQISKWEEENAISLPPAMRNSMKQSNEMAGKLQQMQEMLQSLVQNGATMTNNAQSALNEAQTQSSQAALSRIGTNLNQVQSKYQLPDDAEQQFMTFIQERGYVYEDLMDQGLTDKLASDFKAVLQTPELERLKQIQQRRMAFTGSGSTTSTTAGNPNSDPEQSYLDGMISSAMTKKNMQ